MCLSRPGVSLYDIKVYVYNQRSRFLTQNFYHALKIRSSTAATSQLQLSFIWAAHKIATKTPSPNLTSNLYTALLYSHIWKLIKNRLRASLYFAVSTSVTLSSTVHVCALALAHNVSMLCQMQPLSNLHILYFLNLFRCGELYTDLWRTRKVS